MKERLVELLNVDMSGCEGDYAEELADYLLANGVTVNVPPKMCYVIKTHWYTQKTKGGQTLAWHNKENAEKALEDMLNGLKENGYYGFEKYCCVEQCKQDGFDNLEWKD